MANNNVKFEIVAAGRSQKTTTAQFEQLLNFVESYKDVLCTNSNNSRKLKLWQTFATEVNSKYLGPPKTAEQWRKVKIEKRIFMR